MRKIIWLLLGAMMVISCSKDSVEGNPDYLATDLISVQVDGQTMYFQDNHNGTVSVTYDRRNPMVSSTSGYYKGNVTIPSTITVDGQSMSVTGITESAFMGCTEMTSLSIPSSVKSIGRLAFYNCKLLTSLTIPQGVSAIGSNCFLNCTGMKSITIPESLTSLPDSAFFGCSSMVTAFLPETLTSLGASTFEGCRSMVELTLPQSVVNIGKNCFCSFDSDGESNWKNFTLNVKSTTPPVLQASIANAYNVRRIVVPLGHREAYLNAPYWNEFKQIMERNY